MTKDKKKSIDTLDEKFIDDDIAEYELNDKTEELFDTVYDLLDISVDNVKKEEDMFGCLYKKIKKRIKDYDVSKNMQQKHYLQKVFQKHPLIQEGIKDVQPLDEKGFDPNTIDFKMEGITQENSEFIMGVDGSINDA